MMQRGSELVINNNDLWSFVDFAEEGHISYFTLVSILDMLTTLVRNSLTRHFLLYVCEVSILFTDYNL
jgi:hypothetical protein